jgi:hypothetical protein
MLKSIALACCLAAGVGCKADKPDAPAAASDESAAPATKGRSGKIDLGTQRPSLPSDDGSADAPDDRAGRRGRMKGAADTDHDGKVSDEERAAFRKQRIERMHTEIDAVKDGKVTAAELASSRFKNLDPATVDTDKDGVISVDELAKALEQQRGNRPWGGRRRGGSDGSDSGTPAPTP